MGALRPMRIKKSGDGGIWGTISGTLSNQTDLQNALDEKVITLTKAQYDALPSADKLDPSKVYYVTDYDPVPVYAELDDSTTAADKVWSSQKVNTQKVDNSVIAPVESGATASRAYAFGEHFIRDGAFCTAIAAIASGAAFTLNTNYTAGTIGENFGVGRNSMSGSTNQNGRISTSLNPDNIEIISAYIKDSDASNTSCVPVINMGSNRWAFQCFNVQNGVMTPLPENIAVDIYYYYYKI